MLLLFGIPIIMMIYLGIRLILGTRVRVPYIGTTAFAFWLAGLVMAIIVGASTGIDFRHSARINQEYEIDINTDKILYIETQTETQLNQKYNHSTAEIFDGEWYMKIKEDEYLLFAVPDFSASRKSISGKAVLEVLYFAKGSSRQDANKRAEELIYPVTVNDTLLIIGTYYKLPPNAKVRAQDVKLKLKLPVGQIVHFDQNMETFFDDNPNYYYRREGFEGNTWIMTETGLKPYFDGDEMDESYLYDTHPQNKHFTLLKTKSIGSIPNLIPTPLIGL